MLPVLLGTGVALVVAGATRRGARPVPTEAPRAHEPAGPATRSGRAVLEVHELQRSRATTRWARALVVVAAVLGAVGTALTPVALVREGPSVRQVVTVVLWLLLLPVLVRTARGEDLAARRLGRVREGLRLAQAHLAAGPDADDAGAPRVSR